MRTPLFLVGLLLVALGASLQISRQLLSPRISEKINNGIVKQIVWQPDSPPSVKERFEGGPDDPPLYIRYYLLNITNLDAVRHGGKPVLDEVGPYTFTKHRRKLDVEFSPDNSTVSFNEYYYLVPAPELTNGTLYDSVTTLNLPLVGAIEAIKARASSRVAPWLLTLARLIEKWGDRRISGLFTTRTVEELLFGYDDPLLRRAAKLLPGFNINPTFALVRNMSDPSESGPSDRDAVCTGAGNSLGNVWQYRTWHGVQQVRAWRPPHVEEVCGTDATQFRPGLTRGASLDVWVGEAFRATRLIEGVGAGADSPLSVGNVPVLRFRPDPAQREPNPVYYQEIPGLMNITSPMATGPGGPQPGKKAVGPLLFLSLPGYCGADPALADGVDGVTCDPVRHDIYIDVEPTTGATLRAKKCLMLTSWFGSAYSAVDSKITSSQYLPIFWAEEASQAGPAQLAGFEKLILAQRVQAFFAGDAKPLAAAAAGVGASMVLVGAVLSRPVGVWEEEEEEEAGRHAAEEPLLQGGGVRGESSIDGGGGGDGGGSRATENEELLLRGEQE